MPIARHGRGRVAAGRALASQVHPVFMLPPLAASAFGAVLAGQFALSVAALHVVAVFCAVYTAHVRDGFVDFHVRGEDDDHPLTRTGCRVAVAGSTAGFAACLLAIWAVVGPVAALLVLPGWFIGYLHAPYLDVNPVGATTGYPLGIALAVVGGYYVQTQSLAPQPVAYAAVFLVLLSGVKVVDDAQDYAYDRSISKRTVAVVVGLDHARQVAYAMMLVALVVVAGLAMTPLFPRGTALASLAFVAVVAYARRAGPELATMLLVRGAYVFVALLVASVWFRPLG